MLKEKLFYIKCLESGRTKHDLIYNAMKKHFSISATVVRDALIADGYIEVNNYVMRKDGKRSYFYKLTDKKLVHEKTKEVIESIKWDDGTMKSRGNAFDWKNYSKGIYQQKELAAAEAGRKWGVMSASKKILPRVSI